MQEVAPPEDVPVRKVKKTKKVKRATPTNEALPPVLLGKGGPTIAGWHSVESVHRCMKEYQFQHVRKIRQPQTHTPDALAVGSLFHAFRANWYASRFATDEATVARCLDAMREEVETHKLPISGDAIRRTEELARYYIEHWSKRPAPKPLAAEYELGPAPVQAGDPIFQYRTARLDDVSYYPEAGGQLAIGECKTTGDSVGAAMNQYQLHGQPLLQVLLWNMASQGEALHGPVAGVVVDVIKKPYERSRPDFARQFFPIKPEVMTWYAQSLRFYLKLAASVDWDTEVPRNTSMCTRLIGRMRAACPYRTLCEHGRGGALSYVLEGGTLLTKHVPREGARRMPWE